MSILYFDCIAGASGDMILGALVDAGVTLEALSQALDALHLADFELRAKRVSKLAFTATKVANATCPTSWRSSTRVPFRTN